jgi:hypothetical protein
MQSHARRAKLMKELEGLANKTWYDETAIYPRIVEILRKTLYPRNSDIHVADTHASSIPFDVSVAGASEKLLPYFLRYFLEVKLPAKKSSLNSAKNFG